MIQVLFIAAIVCVHSTGITKDNAVDTFPIVSVEKRVIHELLRRYGRVGLGGRPVVNSSVAVNVNFALGLIQLELDEKQKVLTVSMWCNYKWRDEYLTWDYNETGVHVVRLSPQLIWTPDISLHNSATPTPTPQQHMVEVLYNGSVTWYPRCIFKSSCAIDVRDFPYDTQYCHLKFISTIYNVKEQRFWLITQNGIDLSTFMSDYKESCAWEVLNATGEEFDDLGHSALLFRLTLQRKFVFSSYMLILPCVFLSLLNLVVFWLPAERPDRIGLAMSTFSSFLLLLLILVGAAPPTASSVPRLGIYYIFNMVITAAAIFLSTIVIRVTQAEPKKPPAAVLRVCRSWVGTILLIATNQRRPCCSYHKEPTSVVFSSTQQNPSTLIGHVRDKSAMVSGYGCSRKELLSSEVPRIHDNLRRSYGGTESEPPHGLVRATSDSSLRKREGTKSMRLNDYMDKKSTQPEDGSTPNYNEWQEVGQLLDRLFFILYVLLIVFSLITLFPQQAKDTIF